MMALRTLLQVLFLSCMLHLAFAKTGLQGCVTTTSISSNMPTTVWFEPCSGEICDVPVCEINQSTVTDNPACPNYTGTERYSPSSLSGYSTVPPPYDTSCMNKLYTTVATLTETVMSAGPGAVATSTTSDQIPAPTGPYTFVFTPAPTSANATAPSTSNSGTSASASASGASTNTTPPPTGASVPASSSTSETAAPEFTGAANVKSSSFMGVWLGLFGAAAFL